MGKLRLILSGSSPIARTALGSFAALIAVGIYSLTDAHIGAPSPQSASVVSSSEPAALSAEQQQQLILLGLLEEADPSAQYSTDPIALIGPNITGQLFGRYSALREGGSYSTEDLRAAGEEIAKNVRAAVTHPIYHASDFKTDANTSPERTKQYQQELLAALDPINRIPSAEYEIYGRYIEDRDPAHLLTLTEAADTYRSAVAAAAAISVPLDIVDTHAKTLNALLGFASTIDALAKHADDPFASMALLRTYIEKEGDIQESYTLLKMYYDSKRI